MRLNKAIINSSLVLLLTLGLAGCAANNSASTHRSSHEPTAAKVTKSSNHKKTASEHKEQASTQQESSPVTTNQAATETPANYASQPGGSGTTVNTGPVTSGNQVASASQTGTSQTSPVVQPGQNPQQEITTDDEQELPAPFYYYWVWTDEQGTHNVDWDCMDTINNNGQITYADQYQYPSQAVQYDIREFNLHFDGSDQWVIDFDNQVNANPNHGVVNRNY